MGKIKRIGRCKGEMERMKLFDIFVWPALGLSRRNISVKEKGGCRLYTRMIKTGGRGIKRLYSIETGRSKKVFL